MPSREIPVTDAPAVRAAGGVVLDVRESSEVAEGSIPGAVHIPLGELIDRIDELDRGQAVACLCRSGARSRAAADYLAEQGFDAVNLTGGIMAWTGDTTPIAS